MKITFMGAGSTVFAKNVLGDCMCIDSLKDCDIALYDIDKKRVFESKGLLDAIREKKGGKGTITDDGTTGKFDVYVDGMKAMTLDFLNVELEKDILTGTVTITPDSMLLEEAGLDSSVTSMLGGYLSIRLTLEEKSADLSLMAGNGELLGMEIAMTDSELKNINIPDSISVEDNAAMEQWVTELDLNGVIGNLEDAGVPAELIEILNSLAEMLAYM